MKTWIASALWDVGVVIVTLGAICAAAALFGLGVYATLHRFLDGTADDFELWETECEDVDGR